MAPVRMITRTQKQGGRTKPTAATPAPQPVRSDLASMLGLEGEEARQLDAMEAAAEAMEAAAEGELPDPSVFRGDSEEPSGAEGSGPDSDGESEPEELVEQPPPPSPESLRQLGWRELLHINSTEAVALQLGAELRGGQVFDTIANKKVARLNYMHGRTIQATCMGRGHQRCRMWRNYWTVAELRANECLVAKWSLLGAGMTADEHVQLGKDMQPE